MNPEKWQQNYVESIHAGLNGKFAKLSVGDIELECQIASVHETRVAGLSQHTDMPRDGMIFIYDHNHTAQFQRTSMSGLDISIWFFDEEGTCVGTGWTDDVATANEPYRYVLETHPDLELDGRLEIQHLADLASE